MTQGIDVQATYAQLMQDLADLPTSINGTQSSVSEVTLEIGTAKSLIADIENDLFFEVQGKNAEERKASWHRLKASNPTWRKRAQELAELEGQLAALQDELDYWQRRYSAACYRAQLHASMLQFLAAGGQPVALPAAPTTDVDFNMGGSNGQVTGDDAAAIGL